MYPPILSHKKTSIKILSILLPFILVATPSLTTAEYSDHILQVSSGTTFGLGQILTDLRGVSLIFVGEQHDDTRHHDLQLRVLRTLHNLDVPVAVGLEMFTSKDQAYLDSWIAGDLSEGDFIGAHERNWGDTWPLYSSLYRYTRERGIPMIGLNVPEEITTQVANQGFSSLSAEQRSTLPIVSCDVDREYMAFIRRALLAHEGMEEGRTFERFCEAQLIWDTAMASRLVGHIKRNPGVTIVVIAGNSHSWRPGIPEQLDRFTEDIDYRIILPEVPPVQTRRSVDRSVADYLWLMR
ncbi:MAG: ChaN family lipoprotein [bacterium]|nr:MAG: ChaN family lipoprotein [bacterium]